MSADLLKAFGQACLAEGKNIVDVYFDLTQEAERLGIEDGAVVMNVYRQLQEEKQSPPRPPPQQEYVVQNEKQDTARPAQTAKPQHHPAPARDRTQFLAPTEQTQALVSNRFVNGRLPLAGLRLRKHEGPFPLLALKGTVVMLGQVRADRDRAFIEYDIDPRRFYRAMGYRERPSLAKIERLPDMFTVIRWGCRKPDGEVISIPVWKVARYDPADGKLHLKLNEEFLPYATQFGPEGYTKLYVQEACRLTTSYDFMQYVFVRQLVGRERKVHRFPLNQYLDSIFLPHAHAGRTNWWVLDRDILRPALKRISQHTTLRYAYRPIRERGKRGRVTHIEFYNVKENRPQRDVSAAEQSLRREVRRSQRSPYQQGFKALNKSTRPKEQDKVQPAREYHFQHREKTMEEIEAERKARDQVMHDPFADK